MSEHILIERQDGVLRLRLNRPDKLNALTQAMYSDLAEAIEQADADAEVRAVLIQGNEQCFSSGNDVRDFLQNPAIGADNPAVRFLRSVVSLSKPLVAAVAGPAVGIGSTLLLHCDLVYVSRDAHLQMPFIKLGLTPEFGASVLLPRLVGATRAAEILLLGEPFSGEQAAAWGLVNAALPSGAEVLGKAAQAARSLAGLPAGAMADSRKLLRKQYAEGLLEVIEDELKIFAKRLTSAEARAAFNAFLGQGKK